MSWCGGGLINITPGVVFRSFAINRFTFIAGNCPPSPGFAPCAILISNSHALLRYSAVTPNRPEATCLIFEFAQSPFADGRKRLGSSPPSPESDFPPIRFIAIARASCASGEIAPSDIAAVVNRTRMSSIGSTSSIGIGPLLLGTNSSKSFKATGVFSNCVATYF